MRKTYHIVTRAARESAAVIEQFCQTNGQILLPIVNLIQNASQVVETVIHELGHQMLEQILVLSAEQVAGARTPGKASGDIRYHGSQAGCVQLADRKVKVKRWAGAGSVEPRITGQIAMWMINAEGQRRSLWGSAI